MWRHFLLISKYLAPKAIATGIGEWLPCLIHPATLSCENHSDESFLQCCDWGHTPWGCIMHWYVFFREHVSASLGLCLSHRKPAEQWRSREGRVGAQQVNTLLCDGVRIITAGLEPPLLLLLCCSEETLLYRIALEFVLYVPYNGAFIHLVE